MTHFHFKGFNPEETMRKEANRVLNELAEISPYESNVFGYMEQYGERFYCTVDIYFPNGPLRTESSDSTPELALSRAHQKMAQVIAGWKRRRIRDFDDTEYREHG